MTYSIDIINLCFFHLHNNKSKKYISNTLNISINTINTWILYFSKEKYKLLYKKH